MFARISKHRNLLTRFNLISYWTLMCNNFQIKISKAIVMIRRKAIITAIVERGSWQVWRYHKNTISFVKRCSLQKGKQSVHVILNISSIFNDTSLSFIHNRICYMFLEGCLGLLIIIEINENLLMLYLSHK
jgi:hypothetical protein